MYIHRQFGWFTVFALTAMAVWFAFVAALSPGDRGEFQGIFLMIAALQLAFYQLTTVVTESTLTVRYGIGLVAFRFPISEIKQVSERTVPWYAGYGIRWVGDAWLFNVSGRDAIEVTFDSGRKVWVGTDDPDGLAAILRQRMEELRLSAVDTDTEAPSSSDEVEERVETVDAAATDCEENTDAVADVSIELDAPQADTITPSDSE
jgi:hypothetical protein